MADTLERVTKIIVDRLGVDEADVKLEASLTVRQKAVSSLRFATSFTSRLN